MYRVITLEPLAKLIRRLAEVAVDRAELKFQSLLRFPLLPVTSGLLAAVWNGLYGKKQPQSRRAVHCLSRFAFSFNARPQTKPK
jgi:hypothetical protein